MLTTNVCIGDERRGFVGGMRSEDAFGFRERWNKQNCTAARSDDGVHLKVCCQALLLVGIYRIPLLIDEPSPACKRPAKCSHGSRAKPWFSFLFPSFGYYSVSAQTIARLALPQDSTLSYQATATIAYLISESDRTRSPTGQEALHRGTAGRWGRVGRFGNGGRTGSTSDGCVSGECSGRGPSGEEDGVEGSVASSSSSPLADAASFVLRWGMSRFSFSHQ